MAEKRMINVLIVDDDEVACEEAKTDIAFYVDASHIYQAVNAVEMMRILSTVPIDLAFLDMEMPDTDGFAIADYLMNVQPKTEYVFLTGHTEFGAKSYEYEPIDFLCKPLNAIRLQKTFERFDRKQGNVQSQAQLAIETATGYVLVSPLDIRYISRDSRKTVIHCGDMEYTVTSSLGELEVIFADYHLIRCHQSFLIAMDRIAKLEKSSFGRTFSAVLNTGERIPVSREKYTQLRDILTRQGVIR